MKKEIKSVYTYEALSNGIFFFNVFIALMTIGFSSFLIKTPAGRASLYFGFIMLAISTILKVIQKW